jgi:hypothetical protein
MTNALLFGILVGMGIVCYSLGRIIGYLESRD